LAQATFCQMATQIPLLRMGVEPPTLNFRPMDVYCGQTAGWIKMALGMEVYLGPGQMLDGVPDTPKPGGTAPSHFSAHFYCGQTAGRIKMPLGMEVGLSSGDIVLYWIGD